MASFISNPPPRCEGCRALKKRVEELEKLKKRVEELEKLTAHLRPRCQNDRAMREEERRKIANGVYSGKPRGEE